MQQVLQQQAGEDNANDPPSDQRSGNDDAEEYEEEAKNTSNGKEGRILLHVKWMFCSEKKILINNLEFNPLLSRFA